MLFIHEVHKVRGRHEDEFEAAFREGWMPTLAEGDDARLLWYTNQAHGSGPAYTVITITAVRGGSAWERLTDRVQKGDLLEWTRGVDALRHGVDAKVLTPLPWSPLQVVDFDQVPADGREHDMSLYMEDTMWPYEDKFEEYIVRCGDVYARSLEQPSSMLRMHAAFQPAVGNHVRREVILMQRISRPEALLDLLRSHIPAEYRAPGTWLHDALDLRDQWTTRLLRTASWSPLY